MLTIASRIDVMNRLGRAMADPTRSRILLSLLERPGYPAELSREVGEEAEGPRLAVFVAHEHQRDLRRQQQHRCGGRPRAERSLRILRPASRCLA